MPEPTPEQQADAVRAQILTLGPLALDMWQLTLEQLDGYLSAAMAHGWPEPLARRLVLEQFASNLRMVGR